MRRQGAGWLVPPSSAVIGSRHAPVEEVAGLIWGLLSQEIRAAQAAIAGSAQVPVREESYALVRWSVRVTEAIVVNNLRGWPGSAK